LTIATIFSYAANEAVPTDDLNGLIQEEAADIPSQVNSSSRDKLDRYIANYNDSLKRTTILVTASMPTTEILQIESRKSRLIFY
jgi:hypothetical protein